MSAWRRTYWAVWTANLITAVGMMSFLPFFPSLLEEMGLHDRAEIQLWAGIVFGAAPLSATFMSPIWGALGDRLGRKLMVVRAMLAVALFVGTMGFARTPVQLLLLRLGQGLFSGFIPPSITLVSVGAPPERQGRVAGDLQTALALGAMVGPVLGGFVASVASHRAVFAFVGIAAFVGALLVMLLATEDESHRQRVEEGSPLRSALAGTRRDLLEVWQNRTLRNALALVFVLQFGLGATNPLLELHVRDLAAHAPIGFVGRWADALGAAEDGGLALATSVLFTGMAVCNLLAMPIWGRVGDASGHSRALIACAVGSALALFAQALAPVYWLLFVSRVAMGGAMAGSGPLAFGLAAAEIAVDKRGGAFGAVFSARTLAVAAGAFTGGQLATWIGIRGLMAVAGALVLLALAGFLVGRRGEGGESPSR